MVDKWTRGQEIRRQQYQKKRAACQIYFRAQEDFANDLDEWEEGWVGRAPATRTFFCNQPQYRRHSWWPSCGPVEGCQQCFLMAATRDIKLLGSVRGEAMQRQKNYCIWQQSRFLFKCSEWIPSSATSGCGCISECVKNVHSYVGVTGS